MAPCIRRVQRKESAQLNTHAEDDRQGHDTGRSTTYYRSGSSRPFSSPEATTDAAMPSAMRPENLGASRTPRLTSI